MGIFRKMAWPISLVYGAVVYVRNLLYDKHILKSRPFDIPTICIGNLSVGGTGKTPMTEFLISRLQNKYQLAVLSRGYKRKSKGFQLANPSSTVDELGDEPFQMYQKFPKVTVAVDADRRNGLAQLKTMVKPSLILLDDAFQHRKVTPLFSILLTTYAKPYFKDWYLPTGNLRDSTNASKRADIIIVTKCPAHLRKDEMLAYGGQLRKMDCQLILFSTLVYDHLLYGQGSNLGLEDLKGTGFTLVTGIADPEPLVSQLKEKHLVFEHLKFADHHSFSPSEIDVLNKKDLILTTEKDYMRLQDKIENLYYIKIEHQFLGNGERTFLEAINEVV